MGIFDNRLVSNFIPKSFFPDSRGTHEAERYLFEQQSGCGIRVYPNDPQRSVRNLFFEIESCQADRTTTDIGGGFSFVLQPTEPWDEIIRPGDFVRIFMGDQVSRGFLGPPGYNFAAGSIDQAQSRPRSDIVQMPLPGSGFTYDDQNGVRYSETKQIPMLVMYERLIGKVDRVQPLDEAMGGPDAGFNQKYVVSGRSLGAIIQDISLYYNEWLPGLNAINVFFGSGVNLVQSPSEFVRDVLSVVLSAVPLPQWQLPKTLVDDLNFGDVSTENQALANRNLERFKERIRGGVGLTTTSGTANAITKLNKLVTEIENNGNNNPFNVLSIKSFKPTFGATFNKSFLNSTTTGLFDMLKHLSNEPWNEFWYDMCPGGVVDGGTLDAQVGVPSLVMRQRPYDITESMLENVATHLIGSRNKLGDFQRAKEELTSLPGLDAASKSLDELNTNAITIYSREQQEDVKKYLDDLSGLASSSPFFIPGGHYVPTALKRETGYSDHDRLNAFLTLGQYNRGQQNQTDRILMSENDGFKIDTESVKRFGFRIMELSTIYGQPDDAQNATQDYGQLLKGFSSLIANWYFMNPDLLNGRIVCRFLPEARLGVPIKYYRTRVSPTNPYPKMEMYYCQGVTDNYSYGQPITTTLTAIRGIRYNLNAANQAGLKAEITKLLEARDRVKRSFGGGMLA